MKTMRERYLKKPVAEDLEDRMIFVGGPRQVGKTTFALTFLSEPTEKHPAYLNWDKGKKDFEKNGVRVLPFRTFCKEIQLP